MNFKHISVVSVVAVSLTGCFNLGTKSSEITPAYVPATQYEAYDCHHLAIEFDDLSRREQALSTAQDQRRHSNKVQAFWIGAGNGDSVGASELATVRGSILAVQKQQALKDCPAKT